MGFGRSVWVVAVRRIERRRLGHGLRSMSLRGGVAAAVPLRASVQLVIAHDWRSWVGWSWFL